MRERFLDISISAKRLEKIELANEIIDEYLEQGFDLTLRQLYYQFVARDYVENSERSYKNLGNVINDGRLAGLIDWDAIVDRTRNCHTFHVQPDMEYCLGRLPNMIANNLWAGQETYVEVHVEKQGMAGIVERACNPLRVPWFCCRGYVSQTALHGTSKRINEKLSGEHQNAVILYLGDHDPSGIDMTRDIQERLEMFGSYVYVHRIALNMEQIDIYNPPPNPAKVTDSRAGGYISKYGNSSWELDALSPEVLVKLIKDYIEMYMDLDEFNKQVRDERSKEDILRKFGSHSRELLDYVENNY
jgi:hypothetical protein